MFGQEIGAKIYEGGAKAMGWPGSYNPPGKLIRAMQLQKSKSVVLS